MGNICSPNLPKNRVKRLILGEKYAFLAPKLEKLGVKVHLLPEIKEVDTRLSGHADLAVLTYQNEVYLSGTANKLSTIFRELGFAEKCVDLGSEYPKDSILNACVMGEHIIHNKKISVLSDRAGFIHVNQGYAKCNICPVTENALITSDEGIAKACRAKGIDVLLIAAGYIDLDGFDTGFIGGASFKLGENLMAFTGDVMKHPDGKEILEFLSKFNIEAICLSDDRLFDIGSAILLTEE